MTLPRITGQRSSRRFTSAVAEPWARGREFGAVHARQIAATVVDYQYLFAAGGGRVDLTDLGGRALGRIDGWAPELGEEIRGIADGAELPVSHIAAINARTEILALLGHRGLGECSTVVALGGPDAEAVAMQNWDWYTFMADNWLEWTIPHPDGRRVTTVTEFGIVGKIGVNERGVGTLFNILHHRDDGDGIGVPVHIVARRILDTAGDLASAWQTASSARVSASTAITLVSGSTAGKAATSVELWPGGPDQAQPASDGLLLRTNHFLTEPASFGDTAEAEGSDTLDRYDDLRRRLGGRGRDLSAVTAADALTSHTAGVCCHPDPADPTDLRYETLATVSLDLAGASLAARAGPPCQNPST